MVAFLDKSTGSEVFHQVIDFLNRSHICYALTKKPDVYISFIKQFWRSTEATNDDNGEVHITATIDGHSKTITKASLRRHLKLDDHDESHPHLHTQNDTSIEHSPDHTTAAVSFPSPTQPTQPSPGAEQHIPTPNESPLHAVHSHGSAEGSLKLNELTTLVTKLSERLEVLEDDLKNTKLTYSAAVTKLILKIKEAVRRNSDVSTCCSNKSTASEVPVVSTAEPDPKKKSKKEIEQERLSFAESIRLQEQMDEEQRAQIARDDEITRQWDEEPIFEKIEEEDVDTQKEMKEVSKESGAKRKKSLPKKRTRSIVLETIRMKEDAEKEELKGYLDIIPREDVPIDVDSLSTKYPIVDWKTCVLIENFMYYQIFRGDRRVPDKLLKCHTLFEPDEDEVKYGMIRMRISDKLDVYEILWSSYSADCKWIAIHMLTEKKSIL
ncbi:hypothetical protein Tco_1386603 [Tanacetum coccineum]